jgi:hypothetical protein
MLSEAVPVAAFTANFSPIPRIAPPPLGNSTAGNSEPAFPDVEAAPPAAAVPLGADARLASAASCAFGMTGPRGTTSLDSFFMKYPRRK